MTRNVYDGGWLPMAMLPEGLTTTVDLWVKGPPDAVSAIACQCGPRREKDGITSASVYDGRVVNCRRIGKDWYHAQACGAFRKMQGVEPTHWRMPPCRPS